MRNSSRSLRRRKQSKTSNGINYSFEINDSRLNGNRSEINKAISYVQTSVKLPTRDELIFLSDEEYEAAVSFYRATHPEVIDLNKLPSINDVTTEQQLLGISRETTEALRSCNQIKENQLAKIGNPQNFSNNFTNQQDTESSEEH